jgi:hypothetical protein
MSDNLPISEQYRIVARKWVDAEGAAHLLEETKTSVFSQKCVALGDIPVNRAEQTVKASKDWLEYLTNMVNARKSANLLKVQLKYLEMKAWEQRSEEASKRAEMKL